jgi:hypothetical protein
MVVVVDWNAVCCAPRLHLPLGSMQCCSLVWGKNAYREEDEVARSMWLQVQDEKSLVSVGKY